MIFWIASIAGFALFALNEIANPRGAFLAYLSEADLIPTFVLMGRDHKYRCLAEPPIQLQKTGHRDEDLAVNTQRIAAVMEKFIRLYPDQWYTFYDFFSRHKVS